MLDAGSVLDDVPKRLLIGGEWHAASSGETFDVCDPATGHVLTHVADAGAEDAVRSLEAAAHAQPGWAATAPRERAETLRRLFEAVTADIDTLAPVITLEMGKSLEEARAEVAYGAEFLRWFSEEAVRARGQYLTAPSGNGRVLTVRRAVGPCLLITPWNFPLAMATRKVAPALAAGCTAVLKAAPQTPLTTQRFAQLAQECGVPAGVLNVVPTTAAPEVVEPLLDDPRLRKLSFTGSTAVGQHLMAGASRQTLRVSMELGGNAPFLVFDDATLDAAVAGAMQAKMRNIGQSCVAANRFLVQRRVAEPFTEMLTERMAALRMGRGTDEGVDVGPLIDHEATARVHRLVSEAVEQGAEIRTGGTLPTGPGSFYPPTVLGDVPHGTALTRDETFGPVAPITVFEDEDEAVTLANDSPYGLVAYAYTGDMSRVLRLSEDLETGMLGVNRGLVSEPAAPFGGIKSSGIGKEGGAEGLDEYLTTRYVALEA